MCHGMQRPWNPGCRRSALEAAVMPLPTRWRRGPLHFVAGKSSEITEVGGRAGLSD